MPSNRERNDRRGGKNRGPKGAAEPSTARGWSPRADADSRPRDSKKADPDSLIWGRHPVIAALANPARKGMGRLIVTADRASEIESEGLAPHGHRPEIMEGPDLARLLPAGAAHQGLVFKVAPLDGVTLEVLAEPAQGVIVMLDQITDPQNVGAIFRSALAFGARGIIVQDRHSPALAGPLAKAAAGATERLPHARVTNLSRALEKLADLGWRAIALDGQAEQHLEGAREARPTVLGRGAGGDGVRRLVAEHCDTTARIPMPGGFESLNVSNAAAVALYEAGRAQRRN